MNYNDHYNLCRDNYSQSSYETYESIYDLRIDEKIFSLDSQYKKLVDMISTQVDASFNDEKNFIKEDLIFKLMNWRGIKEIYELANLFCPILEKKVFKSNVSVEFVHPYRNVYTKNNVKNSWLWHYDDCPREFVKLMVYLNDVTENNAPMQHLTHDLYGPLLMRSSKIGINQTSQKIFDGSRLPNHEIDRLKKLGYKKKSFVGKKGHSILFSPNIVHRATIPKENFHRDAIVFFIRPCLSKRDEYINRKTCTWDSPRDVKKYKYD